MEVWRLHHPRLGRITVERGYDPEFAALYPDWPEEPDRKIENLRDTPIDASYRRRLEALHANPPVRLQVCVDGEVVARYSTITSGRIPLSSPHTKLRSTYGVADRAKPHLKIEANFFDDLLGVDYREGSTVVEFEPPEGSRGAARRAAMESSGFKRIAYPLAAGLGKGGWALAVLLLGPLVGRVIERIATWIARYLPDITIDIAPPEIYLPVPRFPEIYLPTPTINLPQIDVPELPAWVLFLMEYSKIWIPVVVGLTLGVLAIRNHRKSERQKQRWNGAPGET